MKRKRVGALLLSMLLTVSLLGGCGSGNEITEAMIPTVTDLQAEGEAQASVIGLAMNKSYVAELTCPEITEDLYDELQEWEDSLL